MILITSFSSRILASERFNIAAYTDSRLPLHLMHSKWAEARLSAVTVHLHEEAKPQYNCTNASWTVVGDLSRCGGSHERCAIYVLSKSHSYPIAFQSSLTMTLQNLKNQETVIFDKVSLNEGNAYDNISGIFTAPLDGIYSFTWTISTTAGQYFVTEIVLNGQYVTYNFADGRGHNGHPMTTSHANIKMKKGDKV
uniref:Heavy metal-binding protein HIP n=1 Tax=Magallana gigas TaxID=29159 RepID=K1Q3W5_MAGGI